MPRTPILALLLRAIVWTPVGFIIMILWVSSNAGAFLLPLISLFHFYTGDYVLGLGLLLATPPSYLLARYLNRRFWQTPDSLL